MSEVDEPLAQIALIQSLINRRKRFDPESELPGTVQVERGAVLADVVCGQMIGPVEFPDRAGEVIDAIGHARPAYRGLLGYCLALATPGAEVLRRPGPGARKPGPSAYVRTGVSNPARSGGAIASDAWASLADWVCDRDDSAADFLRTIVARRAECGSFLTPASSDNPETFWYHDLIILHAVDAYADLSGDEEAAATVAAAAEYHHNKTQTDHATAEPWGLSAFLKSPSTRPTADGLLHAVQTNQPTGPRGVTLLLLADTLYRFGLGGFSR
jgi:hypothetical protein